MGQYVAVSSNGQAQSGVGTYDKAIEWAKGHLGGRNNKTHKVFITELVAIVEFESPPFKVTTIDGPELPLGNGNASTGNYAHGKVDHVSV